jgi:hypothetical protein
MVRPTVDPGPMGEMEKKSVVIIGFGLPMTKTFGEGFDCFARTPSVASGLGNGMDGK